MPYKCLNGPIIYIVFSRLSQANVSHPSPVDGIGPYDWVLQVFSADCNYNQDDANISYLNAQIKEQQAESLQTPSEEIYVAFILQRAIFVAHSKAYTPYDDQIACGGRKRIIFIWIFTITRSYSFRIIQLV